MASTLVRRRIAQDLRFHKLVPSAALGQIGRVLSRFRRRVRAAATAVVERVKSALREATRPLPLVTGLVMHLTRSRRELSAENAFLRQQLIVASHQVKHPPSGHTNAAYSSCSPGWCPDGATPSCW